MRSRIGGSGTTFWSPQSALHCSCSPRLSVIYTITRAQPTTRRAQTMDPVLLIPWDLLCWSSGHGCSSLSLAGWTYSCWAEVRQVAFSFCLHLLCFLQETRLAGITDEFNLDFFILFFIFLLEGEPITLHAERQSFISLTRTALNLFFITWSSPQGADFKDQRGTPPC